MFLHGHGPHAYHVECETVVGRDRLVYRSLAMLNPVADADIVEFSQHMVSLTNLGEEKDPDCMQNYTAKHIERRSLAETFWHSKAFHEDFLSLALSSTNNYL